MTDPRTGAPLRGKHLLIVEDEYTIAMDLAHFVEDLGATVVGPAGSVKEALALVAEADDRLDAAVLDVNLRNERVDPVADALIAMGVPIVFTTGYDELLLSKSYVALPRCGKPIDRQLLLRLLSAAMDAG
jgi:CheY-like chemotaxis protein